ncbi:MAG: DUF3224 domain-containing protein [Anaeromyxobacteraceae bacterium]
MTLATAALVALAAAAPKESTRMKLHASGAFDVKVAPIADPRPGAFPRLSIEKTFHGELDAIAAGEMMASSTVKEAFAAYVALDRVQGKLAGREGAFMLTHVGTMTPGGQALTIAVVPGSGSGALAGLEGTLTIRIDPDGKHFYTFDGTLP